MNFNENAYAIIENKKSVTKETAVWPQFWLDYADYVDVEGGPTVRSEWVGTTHIWGTEYITKVAPSQEACIKELEQQVAPVTGKFKTGFLVNFIWITTVISLLAHPVVGCFLLIGLCAAVLSVFKNSWFFNDSEKRAFPGALKSLAKEALILVLVVGIVTGVFLGVLWIFEKIAALITTGSSELY